MIRHRLILKLLAVAVILGLALPQFRFTSCCCAGHGSASTSTCCERSDTTPEPTEQSCCCAKKDESTVATKACCQDLRGTSKGCECSCKTRTDQQTTPPKRRGFEQVLTCDVRETTLTASTSAEHRVYHELPLVFKPPVRILYGVWRN